MYRILVADDETIERMVLCKILKKNFEGQCEVFEAINGREALEIYEREHIQIAVLDIEMPGINGIEAAEQIRSRDEICSIIFLTAFDEFAYARKAIGIRALDYLLKPYSEDELVSVVEEAMRSVERQSAFRQYEQKEKEAHDAESAPAAQGGENLRQQWVAELFHDYIQKNYTKDISMKDAAQAMNYSEAYFCKLFKQCFGRSFTLYLTEYRIGEAKKLLSQPMVNVREVGQLVGYADASYFTKVFKRMTGKSPTEFRRGISGQYTAADTGEGCP